MNIIFPKLLRQTLGQRPHPMLCRGKQGSGGVASDARRSACEYQSPPLPFAPQCGRRVDLILLELQHGLPGKGKCGNDVRVEGLADLLGCNAEEGAPCAPTYVEEGGTNGECRCREAIADAGEYARHILWGVTVDREVFSLI
jgi:hypothetical protein